MQRDADDFNHRVVSEAYDMLAGRIVPELGGSRAHLGMVTAHIGVAVFVAGVTLVKTYESEKDMNMKPGDTVVAGERIGAVGATGRVTGPHLHWAARYGAITVNPLDLVSLKRNWYVGSSSLGNSSRRTRPTPESGPFRRSSPQ